MNNSTTLFLVYIVIIFTILQMVFIIWGYIVKPDKNITSKYKIRILFLSSLPFGSQWRKHIEKDDLAFFEKIFFLLKLQHYSAGIILSLCIIYFLYIILTF